MDEDLGQQACVELCVIDTTEVLGIDDVLKAAVNFSSTAALESRTVPYPVSDVEVICNSKGDTTLYVVNFGEDNGFIVLSASKKTYPILAFNTHGRLDFGVNEKSAVNEWLDYAIDVVDYAKNQSKEELRKYVYQWQRLLPNRAPLTNSRSNEYEDYFRQQIAQWQSEGYDVYSAREWRNANPYYDEVTSAIDKIERGDVTGAPYPALSFTGNPVLDDSYVIVKNDVKSRLQKIFINTQWGQGQYYNQYIPNNWPVGCTAVALGQVLKYLNIPVGQYDFSAMPNRATAQAPELARFLYDVGVRIGVTYGPSATSGGYDNVYDALISYGGKGEKLKGVNIADMKASLLGDKPVIMFDNASQSLIGHCWICCGVRHYDYDIETRLMLPFGRPEDAMGAYLSYAQIIDSAHELKGYNNWGDDGNNDGFYEFGYERYGNIYFNTNRLTITQITK